MQLPRFGKSITTERVPALLEAAEQATAALEARKEELKATMPTAALKQLIELYEEASRNLTLADSIVDALFSIDTNNNEIRNVQSQVNRVSTDISSRLLFFNLTLKSWPVAELRKHSKQLPQYSAWIERLIIYAPYTLQENEERIILYKDSTGDELLRKLYTMITSRYTYTLTVEGEEKTVTRAELGQYAMHAKREVRKAATEAMLVPFTADHAILGEVYQGLVEDWANEHMKLRNYESAIASRHIANQIPPEAFEALKRVVHKNRSLFREYTELKRKALGYEDFTRYDFAAPVPGLPEEIEYEVAKKRVLSVFHSFAPWMASHAEKIFNDGHIDVPPAKGKRSGACCYGMIPGETPVVILNFTGMYEDMATMAHELGHAVHDVLAGKKNTDLTYHPPLVLAETASTFAEAILFAAELKESEPAVRKALLCQRIDDIMGTSLSQMRITEFELKAHELIANGASAEELDVLWAKLQKEDFPTIDYPEKSVYWSAVPHIHQSPFYCYSYAFGMLLVLSLYKRYEDEGAAFVPKFEALLAAGGSAAPAEVLGKLGYDITKDEFWEGAFAVLRKHIEELSTLVE
jgi:oligoendopeptidase F